MVELTKQELRTFAYDVYYKAITLDNRNGKNLIDINDEVLNELILHLKQ